MNLPRTREEFTQWILEHNGFTPEFKHFKKILDYMPSSEMHNGQPAFYVWYNFHGDSEDLHDWMMFTLDHFPDLVTIEFNESSNLYRIFICNSLFDTIAPYCLNSKLYMHF